ncbi:bifunctional 3-(3-hydroxy-phenyl)propionate/3-hydroxycinnamic acid hydroxylase [Amorphus sp. 3PC139-8]|uniref:bifunctional 3-(3-hydroxy-phenyl)propionate/3-hydroxycinnamic acid hydroxylase MhpA n=1 Tax=Amorphus sp. 3PC139-8 TaxID=2735676 RepID=UPI00345D2F94
MTYDVAIVGYGPTGMVLATLLGKLGRKVVVIERYSGLYNLPRAAAFDDETMRTFQHLGIAEAMLEGTNIQRGYEWVNGAGELLLDIEYDNPGPCGWPAQYMMFQPHVEDVLDATAKSIPGVTVHQGFTVTGLDDDGQQVTVTATDGAGAEQTFAARYVVGADGGNGFVRRHLDGPVEDYGFFENWLVCDFEMKHEVEGLPSFRQVCNPAQPISIVNIGPKHHRFSFRLEADDDREAVVDPDRVWARVKDYLTRDQADLIRVANYTFRSRIVGDWRKGRILLAGDAAHEMPPFLAQGMVSGIRDARNLSWKLDMVLSGYGDSLLDTYQPEREPHVRFITEKAIELGRVQTMRDPDEARERDERMIAARKANQKPDKLLYPGLTGGMIANDGRLLPQGLVSSSTKTALFDDVVGTGWTLVAKGPGVLEDLTPEVRRFWSELGGRTAVFNLHSIVGGGDLSDTSGIYTRWFDETGAVAAVVRPDSYVYGLAKTSSALDDLLSQLSRAIVRS